MDLDHLFDIFNWYVRGKTNRIYLLLHAWEYSIAGIAILGAIFFHPLFLAIVAAHFAHVTTDHFHNKLPLFGYFITYRFIKGFDATHIAPGANLIYSYRRWPTLVPIPSRLKPWYRRRIESWFEAKVVQHARARAAARELDDIGRL